MYGTILNGLRQRDLVLLFVFQIVITLIVNLISQSKNGMASEDPLSQSTVCDGIHGIYYCCVTFDNLTKDNEVYVVFFYPLYSG